MIRALCLLAVLLLTTFVVAEEEDKFVPLPKISRQIAGSVRINDSHPIVVRKDMQIYGLFNLQGTQQRNYHDRYSLPGAVKLDCTMAGMTYGEKKEICFGYVANGQHSSLYIEVQPGDNVDTLILTEDKDKASKFLPYLNRKASKFEKQDVGQWEKFEHFQFEYLQDGKPTGKFLAFEKQNAACNKEFQMDVGARMLILDKQENAATFVFANFAESGK